MDHHVDFAAEGGFEGEAGIGEEVWTATATVDPRPGGKIKTEMGVGEEQDPEHRLSLSDRAPAPRCHQRRQMVHALIPPTPMLILPATSPSIFHFSSATRRLK